MTGGALFGAVLAAMFAVAGCGENAEMGTLKTDDPPSSYQVPTADTAPSSVCVAGVVYQDRFYVSSDQHPQPATPLAGPGDPLQGVVRPGCNDTGGAAEADVPVTAFTVPGKSPDQWIYAEEFGDLRAYRVLEAGVDAEAREKQMDVEPDPKWRGTMTVRPDTAAPGQRVAVTYPPGHRDVRGVAYSLSTSTSEGWTVTHYLTSDANGNSEPDWWSAEDGEDRGWHDVGVGGAGPDHLVIPNPVADGTYLLCTANALNQKCALIRVQHG